MAGSMRYRLRVDLPDSQEMIDFAVAMRRIQGISDNRGYNIIAGVHGAPFWYCWHHQFSRRSDNRAQLFLPWHRAYLYYLDLALNDFVEEGGVAQPWWDWTAIREVPEGYEATDIGGEESPLRRYRMNIDLPTGDIRRFTRRRPGQNPAARLPTETEVATALNDNDWSSFSDRVQNMHDHVHGWVGGDMGDTTTAAYDPVFYAHHAMVDRIWYLWQIRNGINTITGSLLDIVLDPFAMTVRDVLDTRALGYEYADTAEQIPPVDPVPVG
ncbi:tyrosinase family protein [Pseudoruegeria sp. HB172150]|uniref:tyrosinase family protein n=1 Tax=Pseudoruegeria sp. HB172150 TaxID=2721164 RepID=UPI00155824AC|nr:tyrosinase family protein [Pseudoruegeria sp. HB172150]